MFDAIKEAQDEIRKLTVEELRELSVLAMIELFAGRITHEQADLVAVLILESLMERAMAGAELSTATVN